MSINFYLILTINVVISTLVVNFKEQVSKANGKTILQLCAEYHQKMVLDFLMLMSNTI
jgi:hypothetical protein